MHLILVLSILGTSESIQSAFPFVRDLKSALKEASDRRAPVLFCNFDTWRQSDQPNRGSESGEDIGPALLKFLADPELAGAVTKTVCVLSSSNQHGDTKQVIDGVEQTVCKAFGWTPCSTHKVVLDHVFRSFAQNGVLEFPHFYLATPDGKLFRSMVGEKHSPELIPAIEEAVNGMPPALERATWLRCRAALSQAAAAEKSGDLLGARLSLESVQSLAKGFPPEQEALEVLVHLNDVGRQRKNQLEAKLGEGDPLTNLIALDDLAFGLGDLASGLQARETLEAALAKPNLAKLKQPIADHRAARELYYKGVQLAGEGKRDPARRTLSDLVKRFGNSAFTDRAQKLLGDLVKPPKKP